MNVLKRLIWVFVITGALMVAFVPINYYLLESTAHVPPNLKDASNRNFVGIILQQSITLFNVAVSVVTLLVVVQTFKAMQSIAISKTDFEVRHPEVPPHYMDKDKVVTSTIEQVDKEQEQEARDNSGE